jgi:hypothetical protein
MAGFAPNEHNDECLNCVSLQCYRACVDTYAMPSSRFHACSVVLDQVFVPDTTDSILDSGAMVRIIQGTQGTGSCVQLVGVTGDDIQAEIADVTFPILTSTNELYVIDTTNSPVTIPGTRQRRRISVVTESPCWVSGHLTKLTKLREV